MTTRIFLTGDRSLPDEVANVYGASTVAQIVLDSLTHNHPMPELVTGDNAGFESGVRRFLDTLGVVYSTVATGVDPDTGKPAWDTRHEVVDALADRVLFFHTDPLASSIGSSLLKTVESSKVVMIGA